MLPLFSRRGLRQGCRSFAYWSVLTVLSAAVPAAAVEPARDVSDEGLTRTAQALLGSDPQLRDVRLIVSVVDRVAVIGGAVPSEGHGRKAAGLVRDHVAGLAEVKNLCFVQARPGPLLRAVAGRASPDKAYPGLPGVLFGPNQLLALDQPPPFTDAVAAAEPVEKSVVARRPVSPAENLLLPPVHATGGAAASSPPVTAVPPPVRGQLTSGPGLPAALEAVRRAEARYAGLRIEVQEGTVVIGGSAPRRGDAWDLANALRVVPGVARVAVGEVEVK